MVAGSMAQTFSLLLHELATNAAKHGALSNDDGRITVAWTLEGQADAARLKFSWRESGGPPVSTPAQKGFGSALLEGALPSNQGGARFAPDGLIYELDVPLSDISAEAKS
jgi:two-component sensor histidine kinase